MSIRIWLLCVFLWGCAPYKPSVVPQLEMCVHADTEFTLYERHIIDEAVRALRVQTGIEVEIIYDLDFEKLETLVMLVHEKKLTRVPESAPIVTDIDFKVRGRVFGWTILERDMWLVWDRMSSERLMVHTVLHELLHGLGVDHVKDPQSVMYEVTDGRHMAISLNESDREAIRRVRPH